MKRLEFLLISLLCITLSNAQIGYQVSLLNTATGEPRANEKVTAKIELINSDGEVVYSETQTGVTNDFGVLSLTIGNAQSLSAIDWSKYPMFISVTVDNVLIGKTQVMSVPYANAVVPLSKDLVVGTWSGTTTYNYGSYIENKTYSFVFHSNGSFSESISRTKSSELSESYSYNGFYTISGDEIYCFYLNSGLSESYNNSYCCYHLKYVNGKLYFIDSSEKPSLTKQ